MWLDETDNSTDTKVVENNWLEIPEPAAIGKTTEVQLRVLDQEPVGTWRHWLGKRPYNCPGMDTCPVCAVRNAAKKVDPEGYKNKYRLDYRYYFNVLFEHEVKIWSFTGAVGRKLKVFEQKYGDLRDYDISVRKRKTGPLSQNIEYDVIYEKTFPLTKEDAIISETKFDRSPFIQPTDIATLKLVADGVEPQVTKPEPDPEVESKAAKATKADMLMLKTLVDRKNWTLGDLGFDENSRPPKDTVAKLIIELSSELEKKG